MIYTKTCKFCNTEFETKKADKEYCNANHKKQHYNQSNPTKKRKMDCVVCGTIFETKKKNQVCCSRKCTQTNANHKEREKKKERNNELYKDIHDIPTCKICGWKARHLSTHLRSHDLTIEEYKQQYNATDSDIFHSSYLHTLSEKMSGENNPGYQHGGTMSSFSKKFKKYDGLSEEQIEECIQSQIKKANNTKRENDRYTTTIEYYLSQGMSEEEAAIALIERQSTFSRKICIEKYGVEEGIKRWEERQQLWRKTLDGLPEDVKERIRNGQTAGYQKLLGSNGSKISRELFDLLRSFSDQYGDNEQYLTLDGKVCYPDFLCDNKVIEFNGDFWHANPDKFASDGMLKFPGVDNYKIASDIWEKDNCRTELLHKHGYNVLTIWESDYKRDKIGTIKRCIEFLKE